MKVFIKRLENWKFLPFLLVGLFFLIGVQKANASIVDWQYYYGGGAFNGFSTSGSFNTSTNGVVGTYTEYFGLPIFNIENIQGSPTKLVMDFSPCLQCQNVWASSTVSYNSNGILIHSGILFTDTNPLDHLTNVTIDPTTNMVGFTSSDVTFNGSQIGIDWQTLPFNSSTIVALDLSSSNSSPSATPEPSTWVLFGTGILAMMGWTYRRQKSLQS